VFYTDNKGVAKLLFISQNNKKAVYIIQLFIENSGSSTHFIMNNISIFCKKIIPNLRWTMLGT